MSWWWAVLLVSVVRAQDTDAAPAAEAVLADEPAAEAATPDDEPADPALFQGREVPFGVPVTVPERRPGMVMTPEGKWVPAEIPELSPLERMTAQQRAAGEDFTIPAEDAWQQRYAMEQVFTTQVREPNPFKRQQWRSTHTYTWSIVDLRLQGHKGEYRETTCAIRTDPVFGSDTGYPDAFVTNVPKRIRPVVVRGEGEGARFVVGPYVQQYGVVLADPLNDPMPQDPADPRFVDDDGDERPGVTLAIRAPVVGKGRVWVGQRSVARLEGTVRDGGLVVGTIRAAPDAVKIDADRWWLRIDTPQRPHPDPTQNPFVLVPVASGFSCADIAAQRAELFPLVTAGG